MSLAVVVGFAGVLVAAVVTGMLAGLCARRPRIDLVVWTAAALGLTVTLAAQSLGFAEGFGPATFLAIQLSALLMVPLWLSWGLVEATGSEAARFGMRLAAGALTAVAGLIVATDPLTTQPFSKAWPLPGPHSQPVSGYALDAVQVVAVIAALLVTGLATVRARATLLAVGPIAAAVLLTAALRAAFPAKSVYPVLSMTAAALVWFGVTRAQDLPGRDDGTARPRDARGGHRPSAADGLRSDGLRSDASRAEGGRDPGVGREPGPGPGGRYGPDAADPRARGGPIGPAGAPRAPGYRQPAPGPADQRRPREQPDWRRGTVPPRDEGQAGRHAKADHAAPAAPAAPQARPYGRILIFTLLEDRVTEFDRLAEQAAEQVRTGEPDTLVYVIHLVPNAPLQRIFYEIYRDRAAFDDHENQPYMKRFVADRRACVLATNSIELRLKYAKVAPLPNPQPVSPGMGLSGPAPGPSGMPGPAPGPSGMPGPAGPRGQVPPRPPQRPQPLTPLPPEPRGQRPPPADPRYGGS